jgi:glyoxylase I family protein
MSDHDPLPSRRSVFGLGAVALGGLALPRASAADPTRKVEGPGLHHVGLFVADVKAAVKFYTEGLGFTVRQEWPDATGTKGGDTYKFVLPGVLLDAGDGNYVELFPAGDGKLSPPSFPLNHFALRVADVDKAYARAIKAGAKPFEFKLPDKPWDGTPLDVKLGGDRPETIRIAFVLGPNGELIEFFHSKVL